MRLILIRHGEVQGNVERRFVGHSDEQLTTLGREQAQAVAKRLASEHIDALFTSDLQRAAQTATAIAAFHPHLKPIIDVRLREQRFGTLEGTPSGTIPKHASNAGVSAIEFIPSGGESLVQVGTRAMEFIDELSVAYAGKTVVLTTHGGTIRAILQHVLALNPEQVYAIHPRNTSVTYLNLAEKKLELLTCAQHLD
jgi:phosphoserine phosphatase